NLQSHHHHWYHHDLQNTFTIYIKVEFRCGNHVAHLVALHNIAKVGGGGEEAQLHEASQGDELTISYIENDAPLEERRRELEEYQFVCRCAKCVGEERKAVSKKEDTKGKKKQRIG
ncbi:hypothetical protein CYMTET_23368, partial [Cymbomonas tetramitiformis]